MHSPSRRLSEVAAGPNTPTRPGPYKGRRKDSSEIELPRKRIVCPLNPKHTCYEDSLKKHLKKCNSRKRRTEEYYEEGINTGSGDEDNVAHTQTAVKATDTEKLKQLIKKINHLYEEHIGQVVTDVRTHGCLQGEMDNPYFGLSALRHRRQQASLIGQLDRLGLLEPGHCYVEMGAGKGQLSHWVREAVSCHDDAAFLLIDRSSIRYKMDGYHKEEEKVKFERIKMDIEHLNLEKVPMIASGSRPLVAIGKHLCGAATDLTLRCLMGTLGRNHPDSASSEPQAKRLRTDDATVDKMADNSQQIDSELQALPGIKSSDEKKPGTADEGSCEILDEGNGYVTKKGTIERLSERIEDAAETSAHCGRPEGDVCRHSETGQHGRNSGHSVDSGHSGQTSAPADRRVKGVVVALCCHHQCRWGAYVGKSFMRQCGITASDFNLLTRLTSWAVCGWRDRDGSFGTKDNQGGNTAAIKTKDGMSTETSKAGEPSVASEMDHNTEDLVTASNKVDGLRLTEKEKEAVGWRCKRLIDHGRVCYLQDCGLLSELKIYIDSTQTPENVVLIARPGVCLNSRST